jgi:hypothetical protein
MQVTNNLQVPIEIQLCIPTASDDDSENAAQDIDAKSEDGYF